MPLPFQFKYFNTFETKNPDIALRIYHHDDERITGPLYFGSIKPDLRPVHLLFITHPEKDTLPGHFRPIYLRAMMSTLDKGK